MSLIRKCYISKCIKLSMADVDCFSHHPFSFPFSLTFLYYRNEGRRDDEKERERDEKSIIKTKTWSLYKLMQ